MLKTIVLVGHITEISGPGHHLRDYLIAIPNSRVYVIFYPMIGSAIFPIISTYVNGKQVNSHKLIVSPKGLVGKLITESLISLWEIIKIPKKIDLYIGINNFDTLPGLLFKKWKIKKAVYYGSDYSEERFANPLLNLTYSLVEKVNLFFADLVVSNTNIAQEARINRGLSIDRSIVIPNGVDLSIVPKAKKKRMYRFVFQGYLSKTHGIHEVLQVMKKLIISYSSVKLAVIGYGPEEKNINQYLKANKLKKNVHLVGRLSHEETIKFLSAKCEVGIASYNTTDGWTKYCSPLKVKEYLACGMPVIISNVPEIAQDIDKKQMGLVYSDSKQLYQAMESFCLNKRLIDHCLLNAKKYVRNYDWNTMYREKLLPRLFN